MRQEPGRVAPAFDFPGLQNKCFPKTKIGDITNSAMRAQIDSPRTARRRAPPGAREGALYVPVMTLSPEGAKKGKMAMGVGITHWKGSIRRRKSKLFL
jgi:hypothetical protein